MSGSTAGVRNRCPGNSVNITLLPTLLQYTLGKHHGCHPDTCHTVYTINQNLKIDSRLDSKKSLNTPRVSSGSLATEPRTAWQLHLRAHVTSTEPSHCATPHCSHPLTAPRDTSPQTNTVAPHQHTAKKHRPAQSRNRSLSPAPGKQAGFRLFSGNMAPHRSSCWQATIHSKINCSLLPGLEASLRLLTSPQVSTTPATEQAC